MFACCGIVPKAKNSCSSAYLRSRPGPRAVAPRGGPSSARRYACPPVAVWCPLRRTGASSRLPLSSRSRSSSSCEVRRAVEKKIVNLRFFFIGKTCRRSVGLNCECRQVISKNRWTSPRFKYILLFLVNYVPRVPACMHSIIAFYIWSYILFIPQNDT